MAFLTDLLEHFGITWQDLRARRAPGSFASLKRPASDSGFVTVLDRLKKAIACKEKIVIYDDGQPYSFFFEEYTPYGRGICGGIILDGAENLAKAKYSVNT